MNQLSEGVQTELWENFSLRQVASLILHMDTEFGIFTELGHWADRNRKKSQ